MSDVASLLYVREYEPAIDRNYVLSTWIRSYALSLGKVPKGERDPDDIARVVERLLRSSDTVVRVVSSRAGPSTVFGWAAGDARGYVHWAYVRGDLRRNGVARNCLSVLVDALGIRGKPLRVSHKLPQDLRQRARWVPHLLGA